MITARAITALSLVAVLTACGNSKKSFEDNFNRNFQQNFVSSCEKSATGAGVAQKTATVLCRCASQKVDQRFSVAEKMKLKEEQLRPIMVECKTSIIS